MTRGKTTYEQMEDDPKQRPGLRREELILAVTCAISEEMERQGVTKAELARRLDRSRGHVQAFLDGSRNLTLASIAEMADALGCRVRLQLQPHARAGARKPAAARRRTA